MIPLLVFAFLLVGVVSYCAGLAVRDRQYAKKPGEWRLSAEPSGDTVVFYATSRQYDSRYPALTAGKRQRICAAPIDDLEARVEAQVKAEERVDILNGLPR